MLVNPCIIFEVLSKSTEAEDRGDKFIEYRSIPSFQEYVLISQHRVLVEHYTRQPDGKWTLDKAWKPKKGETCSNRYRISKETEKFEAR